MAEDKDKQQGDEQVKEAPVKKKAKDLGFDEQMSLRGGGGPQGLELRGKRLSESEDD